jgi:hypothetical protein
MQEKVSSARGIYSILARRSKMPEQVEDLYKLELESISLSFGITHLMPVILGHSAFGGFGGGNDFVIPSPRPPSRPGVLIDPEWNQEAVKNEVRWDLRDLSVPITQEVREKLIRERVKDMGKGILDQEEMARIRTVYKRKLENWRAEASFRRVEFGRKPKTVFLPPSWEKIKLLCARSRLVAPKVPQDLRFRAIKLQYTKMNDVLRWVGFQYNVSDFVYKWKNRMPGSVLLAILTRDLPKSQNMKNLVPAELEIVHQQLLEALFIPFVLNRKWSSYFQFAAASIGTSVNIISQLKTGEFGALMYL